MKTIIYSMITAGLILGLSQPLLAQERKFMHSAGISFFSSDQNSVPAVTYSPRYNFKALSETSFLSIGTNASLGVAVFKPQERQENRLAVQLPLVLEYESGHGAGYNTGRYWGGFFGVGGGINTMGRRFNSTNDLALYTTTGLRTTAGLHSWTLRLSYSYSLDKYAYNMFGAGLAYNIGLTKDKY